MAHAFWRGLARSGAASSANLVVLAHMGACFCTVRARWLEALDSWHRATPLLFQLHATACRGCWTAVQRPLIFWSTLLFSITTRTHVFMAGSSRMRDVPRASHARCDSLDPVSLVFDVALRTGVHYKAVLAAAATAVAVLRVSAFLEQPIPCEHCRSHRTTHDGHIIPTPVNTSQSAEVAENRPIPPGCPPSA